MEEKKNAYRVLMGKPEDLSVDWAALTESL
jgi:hypothetical protein